MGGYRFQSGVFLVLFSGICYGFMPIIAIYAYQGGATATTLAFLRAALAAVLFAVYLFWRGFPSNVDRRAVLILFAVGAFVQPLESFCYVAALQYISAGLTVLIFYTYPAWVAIWGLLFRWERLSLRKGIGIAVASAGLVLVVGTSLGRVNAYGVLLAITAALGCSFYVVFSKRAIRDVGPLYASTIMSVSTAVTLGVIGAAAGGLSFGMQPLGWLMALLCAVVTVNLALFAFLAGLKIVGPTTASILCMTEPLTTVVFSALLFSQHLTASQLLGGLVILAGAVLVVKG